MGGLVPGKCSFEWLLLLFAVDVLRVPDGFLCDDVNDGRDVMQKMKKHAKAGKALLL